MPYAAALENRLRIDWARQTLPTPAFIGRRVLMDVPLDELVPYIDWTFFFAAWELKGRFPAILDHPQYGAAARELYDNARALLDRIISEKLLTARGVYGFWPAASRATTSSSTPIAAASRRADALQHAAAAGSDRRRQAESVAGRLRRADRARAAAWTTSARSPSRRASAPTSWRARFEREHDDYSAILVKAMADRLAEAFAAYLHATRAREWGIHETLSPERHRWRNGTAASGPDSAIPRARITARSSSCSICSTRQRSASS